MALLSSHRETRIASLYLSYYNVGPLLSCSPGHHFYVLTFTYLKTGDLYYMMNYLLIEQKLVGQENTVCIGFNNKGTNIFFEQLLKFFLFFFYCS